MDEARSDGGTMRASLRDLLDAYERQLIQQALEASAGNQRRAAAALGLLPTTLHEKMKRLGLLRRRAPEAVTVSPAAAVAAELRQAG